MGVKGDFRFEPKAKSVLTQTQNFDDLKAHMLNETIKIMERKVKQQRDILAEKLKKPEISTVLKEATNHAQLQSAVDMTLQK